MSESLEHYIALGAEFIDMDNSLEHYGVKGMKWGHKNRSSQRSGIRASVDDAMKNWKSKEYAIFSHGKRYPGKFDDMEEVLYTNNITSTDKRNTLTRKAESALQNVKSKTFSLAFRDRYKGKAGKSIRAFQNTMSENIFKKKGSVSVEKTLRSVQAKVGGLFSKPSSGNTNPKGNARKKKAEEALNNILSKTGGKKLRIK